MNRFERSARRARGRPTSVVCLVALLSLFLCPTASANAGLPIAPAVGFELWVYMPFLLGIETVVVAWLLGVDRNRCFRTVFKANVLSTVLGFPLVSGTLFVLLGLLDAAVSFLWRGHPPESFTHTLRAVGFIFVPELPDAVAGHLQSGLYMMYAILIWIVAAFAVSVWIEEWVMRRTRWLAERGATPRRIHRAVLLANLASYAPLVAADVVLSLGPALFPGS